MTGGDERVDGVSQFVFAARRFLELRGELEHHRTEEVDAGVVPSGLAGLEPAVTTELFDLIFARFFHEPGQAEFFVEKIEPALRHVLAAGDGDDASEIAFAKTPDHLPVGFGLHQNVTVGEQEIIGAHELLRQFRRLAGAVLHELPSVGDARAPFAAIAEVVLDHLRLMPGDDEHLADASGEQAAEDVFEDGFAVDAQHRLGNLVGEFLHARAFAGGENDCFHALVALIGAKGCQRDRFSTRPSFR